MIKKLLKLMSNTKLKFERVIYNYILKEDKNVTMDDSVIIDKYKEAIEWDSLRRYQEDSQERIRRTQRIYPDEVLEIFKRSIYIEESDAWLLTSNDALLAIKCLINKDITILGIDTYLQNGDNYEYQYPEPNWSWDRLKRTSLDENYIGATNFITNFPNASWMKPYVKGENVYFRIFIAKVTNSNPAIEFVEYL